MFFLHPCVVLPLFILKPNGLGQESNFLHVSLILLPLLIFKYGFDYPDYTNRINEVN